MLNRSRFYIAGSSRLDKIKAYGMLTVLTDLCSMMAMAVFACVGGLLLGAGFLLLKLAGLLLGMLAGFVVLMEAVGDWVLHWIGV